MRENSERNSSGQAVGTGAWLVQNSWGANTWNNTAAGLNNGTFWALYSDPYIGRSDVLAFSLTSNPASGSIVLLQNEVGPMKQDFSNYSAPTTPTGMASLTTGMLGVNPLSPSGNSTVRSGLSYEQEIASTWSDLSLVTFTKSSSGGKVPFEGILFLKAMLLVPGSSGNGTITCNSPISFSGNETAGNL